MTKNNSKGRAKWHTLLLATSVLGGLSSPALAQEADTGGLDEIIVTAQKREENLQDVPVSVQAIGNERLEQLQVNDVNDYARFLPSLSLQTIAPGFTRTYFRGVASGENGNHSGPLPSVGTYLDEQPITTITGALDIHVYDIARIEALAGPQGTLYGASSQAGTIRIITNKPDPDEFSASYNVGVNSIDGGGIGNSFEGYVNIPLGERAAVRLVGWSQHDAGYIDNIQGTRTYPTCAAGLVALPTPTAVAPCTLNNAAIAEDDYNDVDTYGFRAALGIELNDSWTVTPTIMAQDQQSNGIFGYNPLIGDLQLTHWFPESAHDSWVQAALTVNGVIGNLDFVYSVGGLNRATDTESDYTDYAYFYDLLAGYGAYFINDAGMIIDPSQTVSGRDRYNKFNQEIRLSSPAEDRFRFVLGAFWQRQVHDIEQRYGIANLASAIEVPGWADTIWLTQQQRIDRDAAIFGEFSFDFIPDHLTGTIGLRAFNSENSLEGYFGFGAGFSGTTGVAACPLPFVSFHGSPCTNLNKTTEEDGTTHRVNLTWRIDDDRMIYGTWSTGYRPGGINRRGTLPPYESDFLTNYEVGWKTTWMQNRLRFNGALFLQEWEKFQFSFLGANGLTEIQNGVDAEIAGLETDISWAPVDGLTLTGSATVLSSETKQDICDGGDCVLGLRAPAGTELPVTPNFKANFTARYEFTLAEWDAYLQGSLVHQADSGVDLRTTEAAITGRLPSYTSFDLSSGIAFGAYTFDIFLDNVTDERAIITRYAECATTVCGGLLYDVPSQPRTLGVRFGQRF